MVYAGDFNIKKNNTYSMKVGEGRIFVEFESDIQANFWRHGKS